MAAQAIDEYLDKNIVKTKTVNISDYSEINIGKVSNGINLKNPALGLIYDFLWNQEAIANLTKTTFSLLKDNFRRLHKLVDNFNPDVIVCTHVMGGIVAGQIKKRTKVFAVVTDSRVAPAWSSFEFDHYFVPNMLSKIDLLKKKIPSGKISITGIPLRKQFEQVAKDDKIIKHGRLNSLLILAGGTVGNKYMESEDIFVNQISNLLTKNKVTVVCGIHSTLYKKLIKIKSENLKVYKSVKQIADLIYESDVIICKPGGLITSEAASIGKPLILIGDGYGQEKGNIDYFVNNGAAIHVEKVEDLAGTIGIVTKNNLIPLLALNSKRIGMKNSTKSIATFLTS
jgi:processive 1,2-diacylglycerol beta-glucosyltransferase